MVTLNPVVQLLRGVWRGTRGDDCGGLPAGEAGEPCRRYNRSFARYVLGLSRVATVKDVATHLGVSWGLVREIQQEALEKEVRKRRLDSLRHIGIDELAVGKGHTYVTVVVGDHVWSRTDRAGMVGQSRKDPLRG